MEVWFCGLALPAVHSSAIRRLAADLVAAYCWTVPGRRDGLLPLAGWVNRGWEERTLCSLLPQQLPCCRRRAPLHPPLKGCRPAGTPISTSLPTNNLGLAQQEDRLKPTKEKRRYCKFFHHRFPALMIHVGVGRRNKEAGKWNWKLKPKHKRWFCGHKEPISSAMVEGWKKSRKPRTMWGWGLPHFRRKDWNAKTF